MPKKKIARDRVLTPCSISLSDTVVASQIDSDYAQDESSDTPVEDFGEDADDDQEWPVVGIVKEEIDINYKSRYQVRWGNWKRPDGSDTTWEKTLEGNNEVISRYKKEEAKRRKILAATSDAIDLRVLGSFLPHNLHTAEARVAYREKLSKCKKKNKPISDWNDEVRKTCEEAVSSSTITGFSKRKRKLDETETPTAGPSRTRDLHNLGDPLDFSLDEDEKKALYSPGRHSEPVRARPSTSFSSRSGASQIPFNEKNFFIRTLEAQWNKAAQNSGAAEIKIVNEEDSSIPTIGYGFVYREASFAYGANVPKPSDVRDFLPGCDCKRNCDSYHVCACQLHYIEEEEAEGPCRAFDDRGLFLFSTQLVTECNKMCSCDSTCSNRVLQKPRLIPMEIFKTKKNGWGVRSPMPIERGEVLGFYTGQIIQREEAEKIDMEKRSINVVFDLDLHDNVEHVQGRYSVDATNTGNWTRFVNHSCEPNMDIISIFVDYPMESNIPRLAFIANTYIPATTELTINYSGNSQLHGRDGKRKKKGLVKCLCGSANCQGYVF